MQTLAIKYRPKVFSDVIEQDAIKVILNEQLATDTFKQAYLFIGPAGCGKTTAARIFADELNNHEGNAFEIDAASNNGVDDVREIIESAKRKSLDSKFKVFIVDECHMLSTGAWNAMLKLLEEPPMGTVFIMCTTDPQKIPDTILSRVQRYTFNKISLDGIYDRLIYILGQESIDGFDTEAIQYIAKLADGGLRDAISMLDKCISFNSTLTISSVVKALGTVNYDVFFDFLFHLIVKSEYHALEVIEEIYNGGKDIKQFIKQFQVFVVDVCKFKLFDSFRYTQIPNVEDYKVKMQDMDYEQCIRILDWVKGLNSELKWESNAKTFIQASIMLYCILGGE